MPAGDVGFAAELREPMRSAGSFERFVRGTGRVLGPPDARYFSAGNALSEGPALWSREIPEINGPVGAVTSLDGARTHPRRPSLSVE